MGFSFLNPLLLAALAAVAVPLLVHLTDRERRHSTRFPSLRFLTRTPLRRTRRQRLRHPGLFALRAFAVACLAVAFAHPVLDAGMAVGGDGGVRVIALDLSYSMAYGETWSRAVAAVETQLDDLPRDARVALVTFATEAEVVVPPTSRLTDVRSALAKLSPGSGGTRYGPALELADTLLAEHPDAMRRVVLVSDLQRRAWDRRRPARLAPGVELDLADVSAAETENLSLADVVVRSRSEEDSSMGADSEESGSEDGDTEDAGSWDVGPKLIDSEAQVSFDVRLVRRGGEAGETSLALEIDGREVSSIRAQVPEQGGVVVRLGPTRLAVSEAASTEVSATEVNATEVNATEVTPPDDAWRATLRLEGDHLDADDTFFLALRPPRTLPVLLVEADDAPDTSTFYLREALALADEPVFEVRRRRAADLRPNDLEAMRLIILHDVAWPSQAGDLQARVEAGMGVWILLGAGSDPGTWAAAAEVLPATWGTAVDPRGARGVSLTGVDLEHPVFAAFAEAGGLAGPRFDRYRPLRLIAAGGADESAPDLASAAPPEVLARYTDGALALVAGQIGRGRTLLLGVPLDNRWSDLPLQPAFVPFVHQACRYLSRDTPTESWVEVGRSVNLRTLVAGGSPGGGGPATSTPLGTVLLELPSGATRRIDLEDDPFVTLETAGFYTVRHADPDARTGADEPARALGSGAELPKLPKTLAVNTDRSESDLERLDPAAFVAALTALPADPGGGAGAPAAPTGPAPRGFGWPLALAALLALVVESAWSNHLQGAP